MSSYLSTGRALIFLRFLGWALVAVGALGYVSWLLSGTLVRDGNWIALDFHVYYQAARALGRGEDIYLAGISPPYIYPPLLAILVLPLSWLHATPATILWKIFQHVCLLAAGWLFIRLLPAAVRPLGAGVLALGLLTVAVKSEIKEGQVNSFILLLTAGAAYAIVRGGRQSEAVVVGQSPGPEATTSTNALHKESLHMLLAGAMLALAVSIKVLPALLIAYLWWRGPRTVATVATGGFFALQLICLLVTPATARYWLEVFPGLFSEAFHSPDNQSLNASISRALLPGDGLYPNTQLLDGVAARPIVTWLANLLAIMGAAWVLWAAGKRAAGAEGGRGMQKLLEISLVLLTIHLVSGSTWPHHLIALSVPIVALLGAWWLDREARDRHPLLGRDTVWVLLVIGGGLGLLMRTPEEWLWSSASVAPQSPILALLAVSAGILVVISLWVSVAVMLLRKR